MMMYRNGSRTGFLGVLAPSESIEGVLAPSESIEDRTVVGPADHV